MSERRTPLDHLGVVSRGSQRQRASQEGVELTMTMSAARCEILPTEAARRDLAGVTSTSEPHSVTI